MSCGSYTVSSSYGDVPDPREDLFRCLPGAVLLRLYKYDKLVPADTAREILRPRHIL